MHLTFLYHPSARVARFTLSRALRAAEDPLIENFEPNFRNGSIPTSEAIAGSAELSSL
jgi:hypothetical protein